MNKDLVKSIIKEMFKSGEITVQVLSEDSQIFDCINTMVNIYIDGEVVSSQEY